MAEQPHQACPFEDCGSSDAFSWNDDGYGKCHSCGKSYPSKGKVFDWAAERYPVKERKSMDKEIAKVSYEGIRGLLPEVAKLFGIQRQYNKDGEWVQDAFRYPTNVKFRDTTPAGGKKKIWLRNRGTLLDLFGPDFNAGSSKRIYLTEGEYDAASLYQVLGQSFPVKSLPSSAIGDKFLAHNHSYLDAFEEIVYAGELDKAGKLAAERLYQVYPHKFYFVPLSKHKDANDFLTEGDGDELKWAALKPQRYSPENFFCSDTEFLSILREENPYEAVPTGHSGIDEKTRGLVRGGVTFLKAPPGTGKTELMRYFERAMLDTDDVKIAMLHMEEQKSTTLRAMASYELGVNVRTKDDQKDSGFSDKEVEKAALAAAKGDRTIIFEMRASDEATRILEYVRLACSVYGADFVFIDHVQRLVYLNGTDGATSLLTEIASNLAQLAKELNVGVIVISHINEDGHTKYAKSLEEEAIINIDISRDGDAEDETSRNTTHFKVTKNRPFARLGDAGMVYFDPKTTILEEVDYSDI